MKKCVKCGKTFADNGFFCTACGGALEEIPAENPTAAATVICPNCKHSHDRTAVFCPFCGTTAEPGTQQPEQREQPSVAFAAPDTPSETATTILPPQPSLVFSSTEAAPAVSEVPSFTPPGSQEPSFTPPGSQEPSFASASPAKKKSKAPKIVIPLVAIVLVIAIVLGLVLCLGNKASDGYVTYIKDDALFYSELSSPSPKKISDIDNNYFHITTSDDNKYMFFISDSDKNALYYCDVTAKKSERIKINNNVDDYTVCDGGETVYYLAKDKLYRYDMKDSEKIDSDVDVYLASDDGKSVTYITDKEELFCKSGSDAPVKLDKKVSYLYYYYADNDILYYEKNDKLVYLKIGDEPITLSGDEFNCFFPKENGSVCYFYQTVTKSEKLKDYVEDDMAKADAAVQEPEYPYRSDYDFPDSPYSSRYSSYEEYEKAYEKYEEEYDKVEARYQEDLDAYYEESEAYEEVENRNQIREELNETIDTSCTSLSYFDGKKTTQLCENSDCYHLNNENDMILFQEIATDSSDVSAKKIKISEFEEKEIGDLYDLKSAIGYSNDTTTTTKIAFGTDVKDAELGDDCTNITCNTDGTRLVYLCDESIYTAEISGKKVGEPKKYDDGGIDFYVGGFIDDDPALIYSKDEDSEIWCNKKSFGDTDEFASYILRGSVLLFGNDYDEDDDTYTLFMLDIEADKITEIAEDVYNAYIAPDGSILYIKDFDSDDEFGNMYLHRDGERDILIDEDVSKFVEAFAVNEDPSTYANQRIR